jgi:hypothetical protein
MSFYFENLRLTRVKITPDISPTGKNPRGINVHEAQAQEAVATDDNHACHVVRGSPAQPRQSALATTTHKKLVRIPDEQFISTSRNEPMGMIIGYYIIRLCQLYYHSYLKKTFTK